VPAVAGLEGGLGHHRAAVVEQAQPAALGDRLPSSLMKKRDRLTVTPVASVASSKRRASLPSISWRTLLVATDWPLTPRSPRIHVAAASCEVPMAW
jgi:hypothetical protein